MRERAEQQHAEALSEEDDVEEKQQQHKNKALSRRQRHMGREGEGEREWSGVCVKLQSTSTQL